MTTAAVCRTRIDEPESLYKLFVFDTETTGIRRNAEIVEIAIVESVVTAEHGRRPARFDRLIKPTRPIGNSCIHGITQEMVCVLHHLSTLRFRMQSTVILDALRITLIPLLCLVRTSFIVVNITASSAARSQNATSN